MDEVSMASFIDPSPQPSPSRGPLRNGVVGSLGDDGDVFDCRDLVEGPVGGRCWGCWRIAGGFRVSWGENRPTPHVEGDGGDEDLGMSLSEAAVADDREPHAPLEGGEGGLDGEATRGDP